MLFLVLGMRQAADFSLLLPHSETYANEIGNWTLRGSATTSEQFIRLTNAVPNTVGTVCQRVPSLFENWTVNIQVKFGGGTGGRGFFFFFTKELCPLMPSQFSGVSIWLNTSSRANGNLIDIFGAFNDSTTSRSRIGTVTAVSSLTLQITRNGTRISIQAGDNQTSLERVGELIDTNKTLPQFGFFTISAITTENSTDNNDLIFLETIELSERTNVVSPEISFRNRKLIENFVDTRRAKKVERRNLMEVTSKYRDYFENNTSLSLNLSDALRITNELRDRAMLTMTASALQEFLDRRIASKLRPAYEKIKFANDNLESMRADIRDIWADLHVHLKSIADEIHREMYVVATESRSAAASINLNMTGIRRVREKIKATSMELSRQRVTRYLNLICVVEVVLFLGFFIYHHEKQSRKLK